MSDRIVSITRVIHFLSRRLSWSAYASMTSWETCHVITNGRCRLSANTLRGVGVGGR